MYLGFSCRQILCYLQSCFASYLEKYLLDTAMIICKLQSKENYLHELRTMFLHFANIYFVISAWMNYLLQLFLIRKGIRSIVALLPLLGVTWLLGFFVEFHHAVVYIFILLNSTQVCNSSFESASMVYSLRDWWIFIARGGGSEDFDCVMIKFTWYHLIRSLISIYPFSYFVDDDY